MASWSMSVPAPYTISCTLNLPVSVLQPRPQSVQAECFCPAVDCPQQCWSQRVTDPFVTFVDLDDDHTVDQKPPFGIVGWTENDRRVLVARHADPASKTPAFKGVVVRIEPGS